MRIWIRLASGLFSNRGVSSLIACSIVRSAPPRGILPIWEIDQLEATFNTQFRAQGFYPAFVAFCVHKLRNSFTSWSLKFNTYTCSKR